jgi:hypothetical protein
MQWLAYARRLVSLGTVRLISREKKWELIFQPWKHDSLVEFDMNKRVSCGARRVSCGTIW